MKKCKATFVQIENKYDGRVILECTREHGHVGYHCAIDEDGIEVLWL